MGPGFGLGWGCIVLLLWFTLRGLYYSKGEKEEVINSTYWEPIGLQFSLPFIDISYTALIDF